MISEEKEITIQVENVSKKFCKSLKKSLWYGLCDISADINPLNLSKKSKKSYLRPKEFYAVNNVSFQVQRGECLGLIGHNGAGKTTLLKMLNGLIRPDSGKITMRGRVGALIALGAGFNPILTGRENIYINASILGLKKREIDKKIDEIINFAEIGEFIDSPVQTYSSGMTVRLGFSIATAIEPDILILDEVLAVGDMKFQAKCLNAIGKIRQSGASLILVSHNMLNITRHCTKVLFLEQGKAEYFGDTAVGVEKYNQAMLFDSKNDNISENSHSVNSGKIDIISIKLLDKYKKEIEKVESGTPVEILVNCKKITKENFNFRLEITLRDSGGLLYQYSPEYRFASESIETNNSFFSISCFFENIPINSSNLIITVILWSLDCSEIYAWKKGVKFDSQIMPKSTGRIHLNCKMSIN